MELNIVNGTLVSLENYNREKIIRIPEGVREIGEGVFKGLRLAEEIYLPESLEKIGNDAFKGCKNLSVINFPRGLLYVGDFAFHRCHCIKEVLLPPCTVHVGRGAFLYCDSMQSVSLTGVKRLFSQTFANCTSLRLLSLNSRLDTSNLGDDIFTGCTLIEGITLSEEGFFPIPDLILAASHENPVIKSVASGVYKTMRLDGGHLYRFSVNLKEVTVPQGVTVIEKGCFYDKKGIVSVSLPESLERICANAFGNCINLTSVSIGNPRLTPDNIDENAFCGCSSLSEIVFDGDERVIKKIREQVLDDFYISGAVLVRYRGREERVNIPFGIKIISESCFMGNDKLGRVIIPDSVEEIRENAFRDCTSLQTADLPEGLKRIGRSAFENCRSLLRVTFPKTLKTVENSAFKRCRRLSAAEINEELEMLGDMAFYGCTALKGVNVPFKTELGGNMIFHNSIQQLIPPYGGNREIRELTLSAPCIIGKYAFSGCKNLEKLTISDPCTVIEEYAFEKCPRLKSVSIRARKMERGIFSFCGALEEVYIDTPQIPAFAFFECRSLKKITLSENVRLIGEHAFEECIALTDFPFEKIEKTEESAFERCEGLEEINLPRGINTGYHSFADCCNLKRIILDGSVITDSGTFFSCTYVDEIIFSGERFSFSRFSQGRNTVSNPLPERVQEIIGDIYSCFDIDRKNSLNGYYGSSRRVRIPRDVVSVGDGAFRGALRTEEIDFPESVCHIGRLALEGTGFLARMQEKGGINIINRMAADGSRCGKRAEIPADIKQIISWAFAGNTDLRELEFFGEKTAVQEFAFRNCINLRKIILPEGRVYTLEDLENSPENIKKIFSECLNCFKTDSEGRLTESTGNIKNLVFPGAAKPIREICEGVYKDCNLLETVTLAPETAVIGSSAFENSKWLRGVYGGTGVETIGAFAFSGCVSLEQAEFSHKLQSIGKRAFEHCSRLREIIIPEGVRVIRERTFFRCKSLKKILLPSTLEEIEGEAFAFCTGLEEVKVHPRTHIAENAFAYAGAGAENIK